MEDKPSLAQFVSGLREKAGLSQSGLAKRCSLVLEVIENIENGTELFLAATVRQKLARGLKINPNDIKPYEIRQEDNIVAQYRIDEIKDEILSGEGSIPCPACGEPLVTRIAQMYDLEDVLHYHPKAYCSKCPFQLR